MKPLPLDFAASLKGLFLIGPKSGGFVYRSKIKTPVTSATGI
ncbi:hypothetical protein [Chryseobacterium sp. T20]